MSTENSSDGEELPASLEEILEKLPPEEKKSIKASFYKGIVMPPAMAEEWNRLAPNAADRILTLTEKEQQHRHICEQAYVTTKSWQAKWGLIFGMAGLALLIAAILFSAYKGWTEAVIGLSAASVFGIVAHFVNAHREKE